MMTPQEDAHFRIFQLIEANPAISQRELARALGVSVGKSHYLLKALLERGLVKMDNFRRSGNKRAYAYWLTPPGIAAKLALAKLFLRHKEAEYESLRGEIDHLRREVEASARGNTP